jgi:hypothetical protein
MTHSGFCPCSRSVFAGSSFGTVVTRVLGSAVAAVGVTACLGKRAVGWGASSGEFMINLDTVVSWGSRRWERNEAGRYEKAINIDP